MYAIVYFVFVLFVVIKHEKPYFASSPGLDSFFFCGTVSTRSPNQNPKNPRERSAPGWDRSRAWAQVFRWRGTLWLTASLRLPRHSLTGRRWWMWPRPLNLVLTRILTEIMIDLVKGAGLTDTFQVAGRGAEGAERTCFFFRAGRGFISVRSRMEEGRRRSYMSAW